MTAAGTVGRLRELPTAAISDALDRAGIEGALPGISPLSNGFRVAGPAFTVRYGPIDGEAGGTVGDFLDTSHPAPSWSSTTAARSGRDARPGRRPGHRRAAPSPPSGPA